MKKLQILIPQYTEDETVITPMLRSLQTQQGVNFEDIEIIIGNDGSVVKLSQVFLDSFHLPIRYLSFEHAELAGCRANLFDVSSAEYVMWCDADDMFLSNLGLHTILTMAEKGFDALYSEFYEEVKRNGETVFSVHDHDSVFVHGKVYRRQYLVDNQIYWHPHLRRHQDSCFNVLALKLAKNPVYISMPFYLWKWRDDSICRRDPLHIPKSFCDYIDSIEQLVIDFLNRGDFKDAAFYANLLVYDTYFTMNNPIWDKAEEYRKKTENRFNAYYERNETIIAALDQGERAKTIAAAKAKAEQRGLLLVRFTFHEWAEHLESMTESEG